MVLQNKKGKNSSKTVVPKEMCYRKKRANLAVTMPARVLKHPEDEMKNINLFLNR